MTPNRSRSRRRAFTLIEVLIVIGVVGVLMGLMVPAVSRARHAAWRAVCMSNQRQLGIAWRLYAGDFRDRAMPLAYWSVQDIGNGEQVFWWGTHGTPTKPPDYERGFLGPYLGTSLHDGSVFECPTQPWDTYRPQGPSRTVTSTYGYNGYYLSPEKTPGWAYSIGHRPWRRLDEIRQPGSLLVFADALLPGSGRGLPSNTALLDPPLLFSRTGAGVWRPNPTPTTAFRHGRPIDGRPGGSAGSAVAVYADGHAAATEADPEWLTHPGQGIGSIGGAASNGPAYVPDWRDWIHP